MLAKFLITLGLASAGLLFVIVTMIAPEKGGALAILIVFLLSYIIALSLITFMIWFLAKLADRIGHLINRHRKSTSLNLKRSYYYSSVIALAPVIVAGLQSVGEVSVYEFCLIGIFIVLGCVYVTKRSA